MTFTLHTTILVSTLILAANFFLILRYRQKKITYLTDLLARMAGASFFIFYIQFQYHQRLALNIQLGPTLHVLSWINWGLIMAIFVFFIMIYLIRSNPMVRARGLRETLLPLWCGITPVLLLETPRWFPVLTNALPWKFAALFCLIIGHVISLIGFLYLGRAFSIMVQARHVVRDGPYRYIRHPIYVGETIALIGVVLNAPNGINLVIMALWMIAQWVRAKLEEAKLATAFESYSDYKQKTGGWLPKL